MDTKGVSQYSGARLLVGAMVAPVFAVLVLLARRYVQLRGADTDLFPRWYGLRALLLEGRSPYDETVTAEIAAQTSLAGAPEAARAAYGFVYPLPGALLLSPLAALPYDWAGALWLALGAPALAAAVVLAARALGERGDARAHRLAPALALVSVPALWNVALVQPGLAVVPLMALALWSAPRRPYWAGAALGAAALVKPQLAAPLAGAWALWCAARWRRPRSRRLLIGMAATAGALCGAAFLLLPEWPAAWLASLRSYAAVPEMHALSPAVYRLATLFSLPAPAAHPIGAAVTALSVAALGAWTLRGWRLDSGRELPARAITRTIVAGALLVPPAWETNALVLLIPLAGVLGKLRGRAAGWFVAASAALTVVLVPLPLALPWRSGAVTIAAYAALWAAATWWVSRRPQPAARSAPAADAE